MTQNLDDFIYVVIFPCVMGHPVDIAIRVEISNRCQRQTICTFLAQNDRINLSDGKVSVYLGLPSTEYF
jgi:hypothetical protein